MIKSLKALPRFVLFPAIPIFLGSAVPSHLHRANAATHVAATDSLLTVEALNKMTAFWLAFKKEPASISDTGKQAHQKPLSVDVGGAQPVQLPSVVDMVAMASTFPSVAKDLSNAHLTAQQWEDYRLLVFQVDVASWQSTPPTPHTAIALNTDFENRHQREVNALASSGWWFPRPPGQPGGGQAGPIGPLSQVQEQDQAMTAQANQWNAALGPWESPRDTSRTTIGDAHLLVDYGRPIMAGRLIFGTLVPYGKVWRTGANMATTLVTDKDLMIGTLEVPAGSYTLFTIPAERGWQLIINKENGQWGLVHHAEFDLGTTAMTVSKTKAPVEKFLIDFTKDHKLRMQWEHTKAEVPVIEKK